MDTSNAAEVVLISRPAQALQAAATAAEPMGIRPVVLGDAIEGESRVVARQIAMLAYTAASPVVLILGGVTTVMIGDGAPGRGAPNTEFLLAFAREVADQEDIWEIAADTHSEDGANLGAAGTICGPSTMARARPLSLAPEHYLGQYDSGGFFYQLGDLVVTGRTRTNVNDFQAIPVLPADGGILLPGDFE